MCSKAIISTSFVRPSNSISDGNSHPSISVKASLIRSGKLIQNRNVHLVKLLLLVNSSK